MLGARGQDWCVVQAHGECDVSTAPELRDWLLGVMARQSARIVIDLSKLDFLDCAAARVLLATSRRATLLGGMLAIATPAPSVTRLLQLTGFDQHLALFPTMDAAVAAFRPGPVATPPGRKNAPGARVPASRGRRPGRAASRPALPGTARPT